MIGAVIVMSRRSRGYRSGKLREIAKRHFNEFLHEFNRQKKMKEFYSKKNKPEGFLESIQEIFSYPF